ncbi:MAG: NADH:ubiquinone oxidoreductase subunit [Solimicrobium sp.]|jgi:NADH-quinone oxidoreductase subunit J|nr:NADH:ubiquinone oxidoreductase subunit [Solimicrobium sp.]
MEFISVLFYVFSTILICAAFCVITARNPVHAALFLVLSFFSAAALWMILQAEFLAIVLVLVYVGAVMVLFLFVVMMLDINIEKIRAGFWNHFPLASVISVIIVLEMIMVLLRGFWTPVDPLLDKDEMVSNTKALGILIFTRYSYAFEIAAAILLLGIVAAVALTLRRRKDTKHFDPAMAVKVNSRDRVRIVRMRAEANSTTTISKNVSTSIRQDEK